MGRLLSVILLLCCVNSALFTDPAEEGRRQEACVIELSCAECVPDHMPLVTTHAATPAAGPGGGGVRVSAAHGDEVTLACGGGRFLAYPLLDTLTAACEGGRFRVRHDNRLRHLLELGCQEDIFEDVQHPVEHCGAPLQGRAYQTQEVGTRGTRHLATVCFDADRALAAWARASNAPHNALRLPPHHEASASAPLSLLGNFNHMFDASTRAAAERLYADGEHMTRLLRELVKHERVALAGQALAAGKLLAPAYFDDQNMRVTNFVSNQVPVWTSVAAGNLHHLHRDVARYLQLSRPRAAAAVDVYSGTHGVVSLRGGPELYLRPGRFPVPKYLWTVVHDKSTERALALVLLNDPFVAVSEIRESVFCESACGRAGWLHELRRHRNYESPLYGLVFCCAAHNFTDSVPEMPGHVLRDVPSGARGMLLDSFV